MTAAQSAPSAALTAALAEIDNSLSPALDRLLALLAIPSISTDPAYKPACRKAADWLVADLQSLGFTAETRDTPGHPMVVARHKPQDGIARPHILFYGHYDVQPVDPIELWANDPFAPAIEDTAKGKVIRGRGACDDKGQLMTFLEACRAWKTANGALPFNLTIFFEGEEESGSPSLIPFMKENANELTADLALICDTGLFADKQPAIVTMLRGLVGEEITITGPNKDLHSGMYGGPAMNPIRVLTKILGEMHDAEGRVQIPKFYENVKELPAAVAEQWKALNFDAGSFLGEVGLSRPAGEADRSPIEQLWSRPTAEINGIWGGYTGAGFKTVLPSKAFAKISFRMVPGQDPDKIRENFRAWVSAQLPEDCEISFHAHGTSRAGEMNITNPVFEAAREALSEEWGLPAAFVGCGGSIPIAGHFGTVLGMDAMLIGFGRDDDAIHSPNEKYDVECFHKGIRSWLRVLDRIAG